LSVSSSETGTYIVTIDNHIKKYENNTWKTIQGSATYIAVSPLDEIFIISDNNTRYYGYSIEYKLPGSDEFTTIANTPGIMPMKLALDMMNYPWIIDMTYQVYSYSGTEWIKQDANAIDIAFSSN